MLVNAGRHRDAHARWAERALLRPAAEPSLTAPETREDAWSRQISVAIAAFEAQSRPGSTREAERLAQSYDRAGWFREAKSVLTRAQEAGTLSREGRDLLSVTDHLDRFAAALDSVPVAVLSPSDVTAAAASLARRHGFTAEGLRARGLYFGSRPAPRAPEQSEIELAVMAGSAGPFTVKQLESTANVRRIVLDDNALRELAPPPIWASASASLVEIDDGMVIAYHRRDQLRTAAVDLFRALEAEGGKVSLTSRAAPDTLLSAELRLLAVLPIFDQARADGSPRREALRRFALDYADACMAQAEAEGVRRLIDRRTLPAGVEDDASPLLAAMAFAPHPRLALARTLDIALRVADPDGMGAKETLAALRGAISRKVRSEGDSGGMPARDNPDPEQWMALTALDDAELRALALTILVDEKLTP
jgi:hypothetical protein